MNIFVSLNVNLYWILSYSVVCCCIFDASGRRDGETDVNPRGQGWEHVCFLVVLIWSTMYGVWRILILQINCITSRFERGGRCHGVRKENNPPRINWRNWDGGSHTDCAYITSSDSKLPARKTKTERKHGQSSRAR